MSDQDDGEAIGADWSQEAFVPAGDGEPEQWKPLRDLTASEFSRYLQWLRRAPSVADAPSHEAF